MCSRSRGEEREAREYAVIKAGSVTDAAALLETSGTYVVIL